MKNKWLVPQISLKKKISLLLALCMCVSTISVHAGADVAATELETTAAEGINTTKATEVVEEEEIIDQSRGQPLLDMEQLPDAPSEAEGMKEVTRNESFALYIDPLTTDIAVCDLKTGKYTHSNPNRGIGLTLDEAQLGSYGSVLDMNYTNLSGKVQRYTSYTNSVLIEQTTVYNIDNGVRIVYQMGLDESKRILPLVLSEATYDEILAKLDKEQKADFKPLYKLRKSASLPKEEKDALIKMYPKLATDNLYVMRKLSKYDKGLLEGILKSHQFTLEQVEKEIEYAGYEREEANVVFTVPIDFKIDNTGFTATVDSSYIEEPNDYRITELSVLSGFGGTNKQSGFLLIPDGSGVLIDLSSTDSNIFSNRIYGADPIISMPYKKNYLMPSVAPFFGVSDNERAVFSVVEKGAALCNIIARSKSTAAPLANVWTEIVINAKDYQSYGNLKTNPSGLVLPADDPNSEVCIRYFFMNEENVDYNKMAALYKNYLINNGVLKEKASTVTPFYAEMPGAIEKTKSVVGIPLNLKYALTSYEQSEELLQMLIDEGVKGLNFRYTGWANEGLSNSVYDKIDFIKALGSKKELDNLMEFASQNGIDMFLDAQLDNVYIDKKFDSFNYTKDGSRQLDHKLGTISHYNPATLTSILYGQSYIVSPDKIKKFSESFFKAYTKANLKTGLSLGTMGKKLSSNYKVGETITRDYAEDYHKQVFQSAKEVNSSILVEQGNAYTWEYASDIVNLPVGGSEIYAQKQSIPFIQMLLHGYIDYAAMPLNISSDLKYETLKAIETGSGVYVQMMYANDMILLDTEHDNMYSFNYENQLKNAAEVYRNVSVALDQVAGATMINHNQLDNGVYATTYSNGKQIVVNYNAKDYSGDNVEVKGESYTVVEVSV